MRILDQRLLPTHEIVRDLETLAGVVDAIRNLAVRGAPAIGVAAAMGLVVALTRDSEGSGAKARELLPQYAQQLEASRPTAVNLHWALQRMRACAASVDNHGLLARLREEACAIAAEDAAMCLRIGEHGLPLVHDGARVLTHCNAGALATAGIGTALAPLYLAHERGIAFEVFACETRPLRQGARLTAWELSRAGIRVSVLPDSAAASLMAQRMVDVILVGADRIARNGDVANKVGTYALALAGRAHSVPFHVAAPFSTIDSATARGADIVIEHRDSDELGELPDGSAVWNPAFDVTPAHFVTSYITDRGVLTPDALHKLLAP